jgi:hypothetical protein
MNEMKLVFRSSFVIRGEAAEIEDQSLSPANQVIVPGQIDTYKQKVAFLYADPFLTRIICKSDYICVQSTVSQAAAL